MPRTTLETAVAHIGRAIRRLLHGSRGQAAADTLSSTETAVITRLAKDGPTTASDLARAEGMKLESLGAAIAALEEMGMVERNPHPADGDTPNIELTPAGVAARDGSGRRPVRPARIVRVRPRSRLDQHDRPAR
jgi:DNA-binding MarR family transcriptional regulator